MFSNYIKVANECELQTHNCDSNAYCVDTFEGFTCSCKQGYIMDGAVCEGMKIFNFIYFYIN